MDKKTKVSEDKRLLVRTLYVIAGIVFLGLGAVGVVLPLLPTTPFLLAAAWCFAKSSQRLYDWMHTNRYFGEYLRRYRAGEGVLLTHKVGMILLLWTTLSLSAFLAIPARLWHARLFLLAVGIGVTTHLLWIPTARLKPKKKPSSHLTEES